MHTVRNRFKRMKENWLPINREDIGINGQFRIYIPDSKKMKTWKIPQFEIVK